MSAEVKVKEVHGQFLFFCEPYQLWLTTEGCKGFRSRKRKKGKGKSGKSGSFVLGISEPFIEYANKCEGCKLWKQVVSVKCDRCGVKFLPYHIGSAQVKRFCKRCFEEKKREGHIARSFKRVLGKYNEKFLERASVFPNYESLIEDMFRRYFR